MRDDLDSQYGIGAEHADDELEALQAKADQYDALAYAAWKVCRDADNYEFLLSDNELKNIEELAALLEKEN